MTTHQLRETLQFKFGIGEWPETYNVDAETYGNVCHSIFTSRPFTDPDVVIRLGRHNGIMFKNVELILKP